MFAFSLGSVATRRRSQQSCLGTSANSPLDPFAEADEDTGETKQTQNYIHIRIQRMYTPLDPSRDDSFDEGAPYRIVELQLTFHLQSAMDVRP